MPRWLLPEGISDVLPTEARRIEDLRRRLLDLFRVYGYELVSPPLVEYLDALLVGSGKDLAQQMFQTVDLLSGRTLAVRADMTPQVARIGNKWSDFATRAQCFIRGNSRLRVRGSLYRRDARSTDIKDSRQILRLWSSWSRPLGSPVRTAYSWIYHLQAS
jgi:ATP phosphoribosyltransferase regulatory subunit